jgi:hypothetical protein
MPAALGCSRWCHQHIAEGTHKLCLGTRCCLQEHSHMSIASLGPASPQLTHSKRFTALSSWRSLQTTCALLSNCSCKAAASSEST